LGRHKQICYVIPIAFHLWRKELAIHACTRVVISTVSTAHPCSNICLIDPYRNYTFHLLERCSHQKKNAKYNAARKQCPFTNARLSQVCQSTQISIPCRSVFLHNRAILLLLLLIRPTKTLTLHLHFRATALEFFEALLGFGEFIRWTQILAPIFPKRFIGGKTYKPLDHTTSSPPPSCAGILCRLR
jgi:hypothetical protein